MKAKLKLYKEKNSSKNKISLNLIRFMMKVKLSLTNLSLEFKMRQKKLIKFYSKPIILKMCLINEIATRYFLSIRFRRNNKMINLLFK